MPPLWEPCCSRLGQYIVFLSKLGADKESQRDAEAQVGEENQVGASIGVGSWWWWILVHVAFGDVVEHITGWIVAWGCHCSQATMKQRIVRTPLLHGRTYESMAKRKKRVHCGLMGGVLQPIRRLIKSHPRRDTERKTMGQSN